MDFNCGRNAQFLNSKTVNSGCIIGISGSCNTDFKIPAYNRIGKIWSDPVVPNLCLICSRIGADLFPCLLIIRNIDVVFSGSGNTLPINCDFTKFYRIGKIENVVIRGFS